MSFRSRGNLCFNKNTLAVLYSMGSNSCKHALWQNRANNIIVFKQHAEMQYNYLAHSTSNPDSAPISFKDQRVLISRGTRSRPRPTCLPKICRLLCVLMNCRLLLCECVVSRRRQERSVRLVVCVMVVKGNRILTTRSKTGSHQA